MEKNTEQPEQPKPPKQLGGITGRGFLPGRSGNPNGRPRTKGLLNALKARVAEVDVDGRTVEQRLANVLVEEGLHGRNRLAAVEIIFDRLEGRSRQQIEVNSITHELREKSDADLQFYLDHSRWPEDPEPQIESGTDAV